MRCQYPRTDHFDIPALTLRQADQKIFSAARALHIKHQSTFSRNPHDTPSGHRSLPLAGVFVRLMRGPDEAASAAGREQPDAGPISAGAKALLCHIDQDSGSCSHEQWRRSLELGLDICSQIVALLRPRPPTPMQWALWASAGALSWQVVTALFPSGVRSLLPEEGFDGRARVGSLRLGDGRSSRPGPIEMPWPEASADAVALGRKVLPAVMATTRDLGLVHLKIGEGCVQRRRPLCA